MCHTGHKGPETILSLAFSWMKGREGMTREETTKILAILKAAYPNSYKNMSQKEALGTVAVWHMQFADLPPDIVMMAVQKCISTSTFTPSISEVKKKISSICWEAYDLMTDTALPEQTIQKAKRVYEKTRNYKYDTPQEPSLYQMISDTETMRLLGGG